MFKPRAVLREEREHLASLESTRENILLTASTEGRNLTRDEVKDVQGLGEKIRKSQGIIADAEERIRLEEQAKANVAAELGGGSRRNASPAPVSGRVFESLGAQLKAVVAAGTPGGRVDPRLYELAPSGGGETIPADGGYAVESDFASEIFRRAYEVSQVANLCRKRPIGPNANGFRLPYIDETSRATGSRWGGVRVYRAAEGDTVTATKPKLGRWEVELEKLMGLAYASNELLQDSTLMEQLYLDAFSEEIAFTLDEEIIAGSGVGTCHGILNSPALVTVSKETSQAADTLLFANVAKMWARLWTRGYRNAVWFINQDVLPQLLQMTANVKNVAGTENVGGSLAPAYVPPSGNSPYGTLMTRPVIPIESCSTVGDVGDVILADMSQYLLIDRPARFDASMHVRFIYDEMAFRFTYRVNGAPMWKSAITPKNGSNTVSPFITLQAR